MKKLVISFDFIEDGKRIVDECGINTIFAPIASDIQKDDYLMLRLQLTEFICRYARYPLSQHLFSEVPVTIALEEQHSSNYDIVHPQEPEP